MLKSTVAKHSTFAILTSNYYCGSGDTDAVIPVTSTRYSIDALKLPSVKPWRAWYDDGQVRAMISTPYKQKTEIGYRCF